jgi:hypothetical protein
MFLDLFQEGDVLKYRYVLTIGVVCAVFLCPDLAIQKVYALAESTAQGGSNAQAVHALGETGEDVNVGLITARNVLTTHEAFYDKDANGNPIGSTHAFNYDFSGDGIKPANHDTWMAGIVASRGGILHLDDIGVAPGADIHCARVSDDSNGISLYWLEDALDELVTGQGCRVIVTGFSLDIDPNGQSVWTLLYDYYAYHYNVIFANAAGNENTKIAVFGDAYNGITTGGLRLNDPNNEYLYARVGSLSGSGPTPDGRRKPDIVAPSQNQTMPSATANNSWLTWTSSGGHTSLSAPHTAGVAALLLGLADDTSDPNDSQNEVIRAVITNSAFPNIDNKSGSSTNPADPNNLWNKDRGYGRIDALRACQLLDSNQVSTDVNITEEKGWAFNTIAASQQHTYTIQASKRHRLIATLTWDRRVEWTDALHSYLADLDLRIYEPNVANPIFSKQAYGFDPNDNLIKCDILLTHSGQYTLRVVNNSTDETAHYGFAYELLPPLSADFDLDYIVDYNDLRRIAENWLQPAPGSDADLFKDNFIDFRDFALFAENWLITDPAYHQD